MAYFFFLAIYTYTLLIRTPPRPEWNECYVIIFISSFGIEIFRQILASEPVNLSRKLAVWASSAWNCCDAFFIVEFFVGLILREQENTLEQGRVLYCLNIVFWFVALFLIYNVVVIETIQIITRLFGMQVHTHLVDLACVQVPRAICDDDRMDA